MSWLRTSDKAAWPRGHRNAAATRRARWEQIKAIRLPEPTVVKQADVTVLMPPKKVPGLRGAGLRRTRFSEQDGRAVVANRRYRRQMQGRVRGFEQPRKKGARLTPVQPDGRASSILYNRLRRRADRTRAILDEARSLVKDAS